MNDSILPGGDVQFSQSNLIDSLRRKAAEQRTFAAVSRDCESDSLLSQAEEFEALVEILLAQDSAGGLPPLAPDKPGVGWELRK